MRSLTRPSFRFPQLLLLACTVVIASWLGVGATKISAPAGFPGSTLPNVSEEQAIAVALNDIQTRPGEVQFKHPRHQATFTDGGVTFRRRAGGPDWHWQLRQVRTGPAELRSGRQRPGRCFSSSWSSKTL